MLTKIVLIAAMGAVATLARFGVTSFLKTEPGNFPWGTVAVNALGCLCFGLVYSLAYTRGSISEQTGSIILIGFMGALTTFSSYLFDLAMLVETQGWVVSAAYFLTQNVVGLAAGFFGLWLGRPSIA